MQKLLGIIFCLLVLSGCAKMPVKGDYTVLDAPPVIEADAETGLVYFLRESAFMGGGITYFIWEDQEKIGLLRSGSYFIHKAKSGQHTYWAETEAKTHLTLNVDAGKTYYVLGGVSMGVWAGRPSLEVVTEGVAQGMLPKLKYTRLSTVDEASKFKKDAQ